MALIAVTGGIAEGKSTVIGYLRALGVETESSDRLARAVFDSPPVQGQLASLLAISAPVSREAVRGAIRVDAVRRKINQIMHPQIVDLIAASPAKVIEIPLLIEASMQGLFDRVWVVTCGEAEQLRRLSDRLGSADEAQALIRTQLTSHAKLPFADRVVRTNQAESSVKRFVTEAAMADLR
jgi:dephospho-CoA kinase